MSVNKHKSASFKKNDEKYWLTGKLFCGKCGGTISGISGKGSKGGIYRYYKCIAAKRKRCRTKPINKGLVEDIVIKVTMMIFADKKFVEKISNACFALQNQENPAMAALKKRLKENQKELDNVMKAIKAGIVTKSTKTEPEKLESEREKIESEISLENMQRPIISKDKIKAWLMRFSSTDLTGFEEKQQLIDLFVNSVYVYDDKLVVIFNFRDGNYSVNLEELNSRIKKANTQNAECSPIIKFGDPYGN